MNSNSLPWHPEIEVGYFYIEDREYYLYSNKQTYRALPVNGQIILPTMTHFQVINGPVVVTDETVMVGGVSGFYKIDEANSTPFAKTWEPPIGDWKPTPHKYERIEDLTNLMEYQITASGTTEKYSFELQDHQFKIDYGSPDTSGFFTPTLTLNQGYTTTPVFGDPVIVEYEGTGASGTYIPDYIDLNPIHSPVVCNKFLTIRDVKPSGYSINVINEKQYLHFVGEDIPVLAAVYDEFGGPVEGARVFWSIKQPGNTPISGSFANHFTTTGWDGVSRNTYTADIWAPGLVSMIVGQGQAITALLLADNDEIIASGAVSIQVGFANDI